MRSYKKANEEEVNEVNVVMGIVNLCGWKVDRCVSQWEYRVG
jgi:hypothetical protein